MFERFTDQSRRVIVLAQEEAVRFDHDYIGTEHLLLGLIRQEECTAAVALGSLGVSLEDVRGKIQDIIGHGSSQTIPHVPFTPRAKKVLEFALREALQLSHHEIGTEHILLGLIREGEGVAVQILMQLGCELDGVRRTVLELLLTGQPVPESISASMFAELTRAEHIDRLKQKLKTVESLIETKQKEKETLAEEIQRLERTGPEGWLHET